MKKTIILILIVVIAMFALIVRRKIQDKKVKAYGLNPIPVHVAKVTQGPLELKHDYLSIVEAWQVARISSRISAKVLEVFKDEGDIVNAGDILLQLDDEDLKENIKSLEKRISGTQAKIDSLKTNLDYWAKENKRFNDLAKNGAVSQAEADNTVNKYATAESLLIAAQDELQSTTHERNSITSRLVYTKITSPFDGLITHRNIDLGNLAVPSKSLMTVQDQTKLKLSLDAPQEDFEFLKEGLPVHIRGNEKNLNLKITHMYPSLDLSRMVRVEIEIPTNTGFIIGSFIPVSVVLLQHEDAVYVPREALLENPNGGVAVFLVKNGTLKVQPVKKILESNGFVEISGVKPGEEVVISTFLGWANLSSGQKVEVIK